MFLYEGQSCPVCGQHFGETDDVVVCPECGAPHHRACWKSEGHCHFAADHGTERQWAKTETVETESARPVRKCPNCGNENPEFAEFCAQCGREIDDRTQVPPQPFPHRVNQYTPPAQGGFSPFQTGYTDPFGGIPRTEVIDGVSVETIAEVIGPNSQYYLPRFYQMSRTGKRVSWNWAAFLLPYNWLLFRKNLLWGWLFYGFTLILLAFNGYATFLSDPELQQLFNIPVQELSESSLLLLNLIMLITTGVLFLLKLGVALFGNRIYMKQVLKKARKLQEDNNLHYDQSFLRTGGTSFAMAILPEIILMFAQYLLLLL